MQKTLSPINIGFIKLPKKARLAFTAPQRVLRNRMDALSDRAVQSCPAVNQFEYRLFEILSPFDIGLRCTALDDSASIHVVPSFTRLDEELIPHFITPMPPKFWRHPNRPVVQISIPFYFVCDEVCYLNQLPPYMADNFHNFPGLFISGRFPTHIWPRALNMAFEWHDINRDLVVRRGDPISYLMFETERPNAPINLIEAVETPELVEYRQNIEDLPKFTSNSFEFVPELQHIRPKTLLVGKIGHGNINK